MINNPLKSVQDFVTFSYFYLKHTDKTTKKHVVLLLKIHNKTDYKLKTHAYIGLATNFFFWYPGTSSAGLFQISGIDPDHSILAQREGCCLCRWPHLKLGIKKRINTNSMIALVSSMQIDIFFSFMNVTL